MDRVTVHLKQSPTRYEILLGANLLSELGKQFRTGLGSKARRAVIVSNPKVWDLYGQTVKESLRRAGIEVGVWLMKDGERHKSLRSFTRALEFLSKSGLQRNDAVVALGGGVVGDLAGFAAATYLRGIDFVNVPTTVLAQIDSSVGGKTGVNLATGKNLVGAFHQPRLVLIDTETLHTLPRRELTAGWCEAVKQGAVGSRKLFQQTVGLLEMAGPRAGGVGHAGDMRADLAATIAAHCRFKASIVAGDERESMERSDSKSRRILNFGHTTGHALEAITNYRRFRHGEAVGYGMLVAGELSKNLGMLAADELELLRSAVKLCGPLPRADDIETTALIRAMQTDKKAVAGKINWILLESIGHARVVAADEIDGRTLRVALRAGLLSA